MNMYNPHELYHHGILGMKWGVRRFQNKDGTLTPAGRKRKAKLEAQYEKVTGKKVQEEPEKKPLTDDEIKAKTARVRAENDPNEEAAGKKVVSEDPQSKSRMSDDELRARIARLKAENDLMDQQIAWNQKYAELHPPSVVKEFIERNRDKVLDAAVDVGVDIGRKWTMNTLANKLGLESESDKLKRIADTMKYKRDIASYQKDIKEFTKSKNDESIGRLRKKRSGRA